MTPRGFSWAARPASGHIKMCCHEAGCCQNKRAGIVGISTIPALYPLVRVGGVEPPRAYTHCHLKTARLPFRHTRRQSTNLHPDAQSYNLRRVAVGGWRLPFGDQRLAVGGMMPRPSARDGYDVTVPACVRRCRRSEPSCRRGTHRSIRRRWRRGCRPAASRRNIRCESWPT